jgi:hypothetical protein
MGGFKCLMDSKRGSKRRNSLEGSQSVARKAFTGFVLSLIAGILVLIDGIVVYTNSDLFKEVFTSLGFNEKPLGLGFDVLGGIAIVFAIVIFIGAYLVYTPRKEMIGGIVMLVFSIISIITGGGFIIGMALGIIGGALGIAKK